MFISLMREILQSDKEREASLNSKGWNARNSGIFCGEATITANYDGDSINIGLNVQQK